MNPRFLRKRLRRWAAYVAEALEDRRLLSVITVTTAGDPGPTFTYSLRDAINEAVIDPGANEIVFDPVVFSTPQVIQLQAPLFPLQFGGLLTISGPGSSLLTIRASADSNIFNISLPSPFVMSGLTLSGGVSFNKAGAIFFSLTSQIFLDDIAITGNTATEMGGGIYVQDPCSLTIRNSTISGNSATNGAGIAFESRGALVIENSTIAGNIASGGGGGIHLFASGLVTNTVTIRNSTIADNRSTAGAGGAFYEQTFYTLNIANSTIVGNQAAIAPGGIAPADSSWTSGWNFTNSAFFNSPSDFAAPGSNYYGNPLLQPLANNGGPTKTMLPLPNSPLVNAGSNALVPPGMTFDQRGSPYDRIYGTVDIGAVEVQRQAVAAATAADVTTGGATSYNFTITYQDYRAMDVSSIINNNNAVRVTGPGGFDVAATYVSIDNSTNGPTRTATYSITPPGGSWDGGDSGKYSIQMQANQVHDVEGYFTPAGVLASFIVSLSQTLLVINTNDSGPGSLRAALNIANNTAVADTILFDTAGVFATAQTIFLMSGLVASYLGGPLTITGPGAQRLSIRPAAGTTVFTPFFSQTPALNLSGLTISGGRNSGLAISGVGNNIVDGVVISENSHSVVAGGIYLFATTLTIRNSTISDNTAGSGGGIFNLSGTLLIENSTLSGNRATNTQDGIGGGAILASDSNLDIRIRNSTISGNTAPKGGAIATYGYYTAGNILLENTTITGNAAIGSASSGGGGIFIDPAGAVTVTVRNSIVSGNTSANGPDIRSPSTVNAYFSAIGSASGFTLSATSANNLPFGTNLLLGPLQNNGGTTQTMAPLPGSPLINAGSNALVSASLTTDQRGFPRIVGSSVDIGAVEYVIKGDLNFDGSVSISDFITLAANFNKTNAAYADGDLNGDQNVSIADFIDLASNFGQSLASSGAAAPLSTSIERDRRPALKHPKKAHHRLRHHPQPNLLFRRRD